MLMEKRLSSSLLHLHGNAPPTPVLHWLSIVYCHVCDKSLAVSFSSNSSPDGELPVMVNLSSPGQQNGLHLSLRTDIVIGMQYNVTMVAQIALGASEQSDSILVTKQAAGPSEAVRQVRPWPYHFLNS